MRFAHTIDRPLDFFMDQFHRVFENFDDKLKSIQVHFDGDSNWDDNACKFCILGIALVHHLETLVFFFVDPPRGPNDHWHEWGNGHGIRQIWKDTNAVAFLVEDPEVLQHLKRRSSHYRCIRKFLPNPLATLFAFFAFILYTMATLFEFILYTLATLFAFILYTLATLFAFIFYTFCTLFNFFAYMIAIGLVLTAIGWVTAIQDAHFQMKYF